MKKILFIGTLATVVLVPSLTVYFVNKQIKNNNEKKDKKSKTKELDELFIDKPNSANKNLNIDFIDVGQADSILITSPEYNVLIDSGNFKTESNRDNNLIHTPNYDKKLKPFLNKRLKDKKIDLFVITHAHTDHIGGMAQAINDFGIPNESSVLSYGDNASTTATYRKVLNAIATNNLNYIDPNLKTTLENNFWKESFASSPTYMNESGEWNMNKLKNINSKETLYSWDDNIWLDFIAPSFDYHPNKPKKDLNESSINLYLRYDNMNLLFTGDSEGKTHEDVYTILQDEKYDIKNNKIDFYKSAHHGSSTQNSNNTNFLQNILNSESKIIISHNDNKVFGKEPNSNPTLTKKSLKLIDETNLFLQTSPILDTQSLGDIELFLNNKGGEFNFIHRKDPSYTMNKPLFWNDEMYGRLFVK